MAWLAMVPKRKFVPITEASFVMRSVRSVHGSSVLSRLIVAPAAVAIIAGCSTLPSSGPTGAQVVDKAEASSPEITIIEVSDVANLPPARRPESLLPAPLTGRYATDLIGPGDFLDITIYEAGVSLFSANGGSSIRALTEPSAGVERLSATRVDDAGYVPIPFAGRLKASGFTTAQLALSIRNALKGMSQDPQVIVSMRESIANSILIGGDVGRPGRLALSTGKETLSDVVALVGGYKGDAKDYTVRIQRNATTSEVRLSEALSIPARDFQIYPGDRISVIRQPQSFSVMGAAGRVEQIIFPTTHVTLAEALAQSGGTNPDTGDPKAVFILRFVEGAAAQEVPTVYHFNMMNTKSYFLAQRFEMRDKDVLYVGNARANQPSKLIQIVGQLFSPIVMVQAAVRKN